VDHSAGDLPVFESGAIMWWAASQDPEGKLFPKDTKGQADVMSWLMFQMVRSAAVDVHTQKIINNNSKINDENHA